MTYRERVVEAEKMLESAFDFNTDREHAALLVAGAQVEAILALAELIRLRG